MAMGEQKSGRAEEIVADAIHGRHDDVFLVTKVLPQHASRQAMMAACKASRRRLRTDRVDLYLLMAYSPLGQGALQDHPVLEKIGARHNATAGQIALAWLMLQEVIVIPKAVRPEHVHENYKALTIRLDKADLEAIDVAFPSPDGPTPLEVV